jgi:hypothetical protein
MKSPLDNIGFALKGVAVYVCYEIQSIQVNVCYDHGYNTPSSWSTLQ